MDVGLGQRLFERTNPQAGFQIVGAVGPAWPPRRIEKLYLLLVRTKHYAAFLGQGLLNCILHLLLSVMNLKASLVAACGAFDFSGGP